MIASIPASAYPGTRVHRRESVNRLTGPPFRRQLQTLPQLVTEKTSPPPRNRSGGMTPLCGADPRRPIADHVLIYTNWTRPGRAAARQQLDQWFPSLVEGKTVSELHRASRRAPCSKEEISTASDRLAQVGGRTTAVVCAAVGSSDSVLYQAFSPNPLLFRGWQSAQNVRLGSRAEVMVPFAAATHSIAYAGRSAEARPTTKQRRRRGRCITAILADRGGRRGSVSRVGGALSGRQSGRRAAAERRQRCRVCAPLSARVETARTNAVSTRCRHHLGLNPGNTECGHHADGARQSGSWRAAAYGSARMASRMPVQQRELAQLTAVDQDPTVATTIACRAWCSKPSTPALPPICSSRSSSAITRQREHFAIVAIEQPISSTVAGQRVWKASSTAVTTMAAFVIGRLQDR